VSDNPRIDELRRRVQKDPASIAFAQLAEEFRRSGDFEEAARVCRAGLERHPSYLSARVTLGRALIELKQYDEAQTELDYVLRSAPENLAAIRGLAEIHQRRGELPEALRQYQTALGIAKHDPELEESVHDLSRQLGTEPAPADTQPEPSTTSVVEVPEAIIVTPEADAIPAVSSPDPLPSLTPELEAAADEFTRALQALDALSLDLPGETQQTHEAPEQPPAPTPEPALERFEGVEETFEEKSPATLSVEPEIAESESAEPQIAEFQVAESLVTAPDSDDLATEASTPEPLPEEPQSPLVERFPGVALRPEPASGDDAVVDELESWLDAIVLDRETRTSKP
jgi:hypothetical protein